MTTPTTTLTFADLAAQYDDELADLRDAYEELTDWIRENVGDEALEWNPAQAEAELLSDEDMERFVTVQATRRAYDESGKEIQKRQHALNTLADEYDGDTFELRMLTGSELMDIETQLRMDAHARGVDDISLLQAERKALVVDTATVDAPGGVPTDDEGDPTPSDCPQPLTLALYEEAGRLNNAGTVDFRAPGFGDEAGSAPSSMSATPTPSASAPGASAPSDEPTPPSGDS